MKTTYKIDPAHSSAHFIVRHLMITNVRGGFTSVQGTVVYDPEDLSGSSIDVVIDVNSLSTSDASRDGHLKSADFLDVEKYPTITFKSKTITKEADGDLLVKGDLTIHGVTKEVSSGGRRPDRGRKRPVGECADRRFRSHQNQAQRVRADLECGAGERRIFDWRRSQT